MSILAIGAHYDDIILSMGQFIAGQPAGSVTCLTVFSGIPTDKKLLTDYDKSCGFSSSKEAMEARRWEDGQATAMLGADRLDLGWFDSQYPEFNGYEGLAEDIQELIESGDYEMVVGPMGLRHPDHVAVSEALLDLELDNLYLYEDLPARVTHPELVLERLLKMPPMSRLEFIGDGPIELKMRALMCYKSQMGRGDLNPYNLYVSERFWKV